MRALITFGIVMAIGALAALLLERAGLGSASGFAWGVAYMLAAALVINSRATAA